MNYIKRIIGCGSVALMLASTAYASDQVTYTEDYFISSPTLLRNGNLMSVGMAFDFNDLRLGKNQAALFSPMIVSETDTLRLNTVGVFGRTAWYQYERGILKTNPQIVDIPVKYSKNLPSTLFEQNVAYCDWMDGSALVVKMDFYGCASCDEGKALSDALAVYVEEKIIDTMPSLIFRAAIEEEEKVRELSGRAYVEFPVNKTEIYPDFRNNAMELGKITATIDSVKNDPDITVTSIGIVGTASPEGPYANNVYLAKTRTLSLKDYVTKLYNFPKDFIKTDYVPVDWQGLSEWLENNTINHREEILAIVNSDMEPFARNSKIKKDFPTEYGWLLKNVYPSLRHSDYKIEYNIREYSNVEEIAEIIKTKPQKLSLGEMYRLAASLEPGTPEYNDVFEVAVRLYPDDETANLNAANAALARGDLVYAERYLAKAGNSPEAVYARGVLKGVQGDYDSAVSLLQQAQAQGLAGVDEALEIYRHNLKVSRK